MKLNKLWTDAIQARFAMYPDEIMPIMSPNLVALAQKSTKTAAVLVPLCNRFGVPSVLFTIRSTKVGSHKGQVSFPGGHIETDESELQAAFRETYEELGSSIGPLTFLGKAQQIPAITGTMVTPIIGIIDADVEDFKLFTPSADEVERVFTVPIRQLLDPTFRKVEVYERNGITLKLPYFGVWGDPECIWGLTGTILDACLRELIAPTLPIEACTDTIG